MKIATFRKYEIWRTPSGNYNTVQSNGELLRVGARTIKDAKIEILSDLGLDIPEYLLSRRHDGTII